MMLIEKQTKQKENQELLIVMLAKSNLIERKNEESSVDKGGTAENSICKGEQNIGRVQPNCSKGGEAEGEAIKHERRGKERWPNFCEKENKADNIGSSSLSTSLCLLLSPKPTNLNMVVTIKMLKPPNLDLP